jgi:type II secretion system protein J
MNKRAARAGQNRAGYLLLEVLLALAVLSLAVVMIFQIIQTTLKVTAEIDFLQVEQRKVDSLFELMRRNFTTMPVTALFQTRTVNRSTQLIFRYAPFNFTWVRAGSSYGTVIIATQPQPDGSLALSILEDTSDKSDSRIADVGDQKAGWFPLLTEVEFLKWRFYSEQSGTWSSEWQDTGVKPNLVEMTFKLVGREHTDTCIYRWPVAQTGP